MKNSNLNRFSIIDQIRGMTIILMIFFHFTFDLTLFEFIKLDIIHSPFWYFLPRFIVFNFLFCAGLSQAIVHFKKIHFQKFFSRFLKILFFAFLISIVTFIFFPENWIYFGTLHVIAFLSLTCLPLIRYPKISLFIGISLFIPSIFFNLNIPWFVLSHDSWDYIAPFPWMGAFLFGHFAYSKEFHFYQFKNFPSRLLNFLALLGRHSLKIYLIHQPILFGTCYLIHKLTH